MSCIYYSDGVVIKLLQWINPSTPIPLLRTQLYYLVCIVFRLALYNLVYVMRNEWQTHVAVAIASSVAIIHLSLSAFQPNQRQWWSKKFQLLMSILVLLATIMTPYTNLLVPVLLYVSLLGGLVQRWLYCHLQS